MATATHLVLRALPGPGGRTYRAQERIDVSGIDPTRLRALESQRFVRPLTNLDLVEAAPDSEQSADAAAPPKRGRKGR